ncbi:hypothetical protein [Thiothrix subterranea]|uniref:hypothetical protein n=1 Tax=Thiothrix subterranea TaxID=2735563 RepID=UPI00280B73DB|nr:hypothetical protein [Thiothrix subterranea]
MKTTLLASVLLVTGLGLPVTLTAEELHSRIDIDATAGETSIIVMPFSPLSKVVEADLQRSGRFALMNRHAQAVISPPMRCVRLEQNTP